MKTNDKTHEGQPETLPDVRPELATMGRGSLQRRIAELENELAAATSIDEKILSALHERVGRCGHCGSKSCLQRKSWSVLPERLLTADVLDAIKEASK